MNNQVKINPAEIPDRVIATLCNPLLDLIADYYKVPANVGKFIEWHKKRYGCLPSNIDSLNAALEGSGSI